MNNKELLEKYFVQIYEGDDFKGAEHLGYCYDDLCSVISLVRNHLNQEITEKIKTLQEASNIHARNYAKQGKDIDKQEFDKCEYCLNILQSLLSL